MLFLIGVISATTVISFNGGSIAGSARITKANIDSAVDTAVTASISQAGLNAVTPERLINDVPEVIIVDKDTDLRAGEYDRNAVSVLLNGEAGVIAAAALSADDFCFFSRVVLAASLDDTPRQYGVVKAGASTPCNAEYANGLLSSSTSTGPSWADPVVFG